MLRHLLSAALITTVVWLPTATRASEYRLGPQDKLKISVYDWRPETNDMHEWTALTGEFTVGANGSLFLSIVDELKTADMTTGQIAAEISKRVQAKLGLTRPPFVSVEVVEYRPFYVLGAVAKPGEYAFRPGLTVLQAVGVSGGLERADDIGARTIARDKIASRGDLNALDAERLQLLMRQARLRATVEDAPTLTLPPEIEARKSETDVARLISDETELFESERASVTAQLASLQQTKTLLQQEIKSLNTKDASLERQIDLAKDNLSKLNNLVARQLAVASSQLSMEQTVSQSESSLLDMQLARLRAQQAFTEADRQSIEIQNKAKAQALADLNATRARLADIAERMTTANALLDEADRHSSLDVADAGLDGTREPLVRYSVIRDDGHGPQALPVQETSILHPGDTLKVERAAQGVALVKGTD